MIIQAKTARIEFDFEHDMVHVYFEDANIRKAGVER